MAHDKTAARPSRRLVLASAVALAGSLSSSCEAVEPARDADGRWLQVNGAPQWLLVKGPPAPAPTVLVLHGGPGGSETVLFRHYNHALEGRLRMVYWDQRGAGRSYDPAASPAKLTVAQMLDDLGVVVDRLKTEFPGPLVLLGHSWGSALGALHAARRPETIAGFIGVNQVSSALEQDAASYAWLIDEARRRANKAVAELQQIGPPPYDYARLVVKNHWVEAFGGYFHPGFNRTGPLLGALLKGETSIGEVRRLIAANDATLKAMQPELSRLDVPAAVPRLEVPAAFLLGRLDRQCPAEVAARWIEPLPALSKSLAWFEHSAHNVPFEEPAVFNATVLKTLKGWNLLSGA